MGLEHVKQYNIKVLSLFKLNSEMADVELKSF